MANTLDIMASGLLLFCAYMSYRGRREFKLLMREWKDIMKNIKDFMKQEI